MTKISAANPTETKMYACSGQTTLKSRQQSDRSRLKISFVARPSQLDARRQESCLAVN